MPEGDTVWRAARQLHRALAGQVLTRSDFRVPRYATTELAGRTVREAVPRGKHLLIRVDGGVTVHTHLKMEGIWRIRPAAGTSSGYFPRDHRIRLILANQRWVATGYRLGIVEVLATSAEHRAVGHLGPDLLGPDWDAAEAVRRLAADPARTAAEALLDQRNLAGIGNVYKSEILFLRGIHPWRPVGEVGDLAGLVELARRVLEDNKERIDRVLTGSDTRGERTWVYGRRHQPCRRCGTPVRSGELGPASEERVTYWCPHCQPEARPAPS
jgi:endonuclease VIII